MTETPKIEFPQRDYPIKVIGDNSEGFYLQEFVIECVTRHLPDWDAGQLSIRRSGKGNYLAVSISCDIDSLKQLQNLVQDLKSNKHVRLVL